jgi:hypothetical protein
MGSQNRHLALNHLDESLLLVKRNGTDGLDLAALFFCETPVLSHTFAVATSSTTGDLIDVVCRGAKTLCGIECFHI